MWETTHDDKKNPRFNSFVAIVCGVLQCDQESTAHTYRFHLHTTVNTGNIAQSNVTLEESNGRQQTTRNGSYCIVLYFFFKFAGIKEMVVLEIILSDFPVVWGVLNYYLKINFKYWPIYLQYLLINSNYVYQKIYLKPDNNWYGANISCIPNLFLSFVFCNFYKRLLAMILIFLL